MKFISFFETTQFLLDNGRQFFNPERNLAFFDLDRVMKKPSSQPVKKSTNLTKSKPVAKKKPLSSSPK
ncbi:MAG: hypothetical protein QJQ54_00600 [Mollicutes bacterium]|nr:MAG: hypothetical protein QJQ54_00600 [Mollicutes bacterium]